MKRYLAIALLLTSFSFAQATKGTTPPTELTKTEKQAIELVQKDKTIIEGRIQILQMQFQQLQQQYNTVEANRSNLVEAARKAHGFTDKAKWDDTSFSFTEPVPEPAKAESKPEPVKPEAKKK